MALKFVAKHNAHSKEMKIVISYVCDYFNITKDQIFFKENKKSLSFIMFASMEFGYSIINMTKLFFMYDYFLKADQVFDLIRSAYIEISSNKKHNEFFNKLMINAGLDNYEIKLIENMSLDTDGIVNSYIQQYYSNEGIEYVIEALHKDFKINVSKELVENRIKKMKL